MSRLFVPATAVLVALSLGGLPTPLDSAPKRLGAAPQGKRACKPDCRKKRCGSDGCGGHCGECPTGQSCHSARCMKRPKDPCRALYGTWVGAMYLNPTHILKGKVWGTRHACFGRFRITFPLRTGHGSADENFTISFPGKRVYFRGTRVTRSTAGSRYVLDNFSGIVDYRRGRFRGVFHDGKITRGTVVLRKK